MADVTLVVEDGTGLSTANTYATVAAADTYHAARLHTRDWDQADTPTRNRALTWATRLLDEQVRWRGDRMSTTQALEWPRANVLVRDRDAYLSSDAVPTWLRDATAEFARHLIAGDRTKAVEQQRVTSRSGSSASVGLGPKDRQHLAIVPPAVLSMIAPYIIASTVRMERV